MFPLIARAGGVLTRSGHTEAANDLGDMAALPDVAVLAEAVNDDGTVKRLADLTRFAREHGLRIISIEDLIADRLKNKKLIHRLHQEQRIIDGMEATLHIYGVDGDEPSQHVAVTFGAIGDGRNVPCRIQQEDVIANMLGSGPKDGIPRFVSSGHRDGACSPCCDALAWPDRVPGRGVAARGPPR